MPVLKTGERLRSAVCSTEVIVIRTPGGDVPLRCGGAELLPLGQGDPGDAQPDPGLSGGTQVGKRYVNEAATLEILCTKAGDGSLTCGDEVLTVKAAKPLPSSD